MFKEETKIKVFAQKAIFCAKSLISFILIYLINNKKDVYLQN